MNARVTLFKQVELDLIDLFRDNIGTKESFPNAFVFSSFSLLGVICDQFLPTNKLLNHKYTIISNIYYVCIIYIELCTSLIFSICKFFS